MTGAQGEELWSKMVTFSHHLLSIKCHLLNAEAPWGAEGATRGGSSHKSAKTHSTRAELVKEEINEVFSS